MVVAPARASQSYRQPAKQPRRRREIGFGIGTRKGPGLGHRIRTQAPHPMRERIFAAAAVATSYKRVVIRMCSM